MKLCFLDTETTGTDPERHGILQIAGIVEGIEFDFKVRPFPDDVIEEEAVTVSGLSGFKDFPEPKEIHRKLVEIFGSQVDKYDKKDKMFLVGYNAKFDYDFLRRFFEKCGDVYFGSWFWYPPYDVMQDALRSLMERRAELKNFKLSTVAQALGIEVLNAHDALADCKTTKQIFERSRSNG